MFKFLVMLLLALVSPAFAKGNNSPSWVSQLKAAQDAQQLVIVSGTHGTNARFSLHEKDSSGVWHEVIHAPAYIGKNGWGKTR
ncbi:MAG: hypothetical protein IJF90_01145, partial [Synergistaceae bacterium]|nr:hypothetical protein [Synergistaceae bacterium]